MKACLIEAPGRTRIVQYYPKPRLDQEHNALVRVYAAAQNPPDSFSTRQDPGRPGHMMGSDFSGWVDQLLLSGEKRTTMTTETTGKSRFDLEVGDRVCGMVLGNASKGSGSFAEYIATSSDLLVKVPDEIRMEEASTFGMSLWTAIQALHFKSNLEWPIRPPKKKGERDQPDEILIWGGATSVGMFAIQLANFSAFKVVDVAKSSHRELLETYGADIIYDYSDRNSIERLMDENRNVALALDCVASTSTVEECIGLIRREGGHVHHVLPMPPDFQNPRQDQVTTKFSLVHSMLGDNMSWSSYLFKEPIKETEVRKDFEMAKKWFSFDQGYVYQLIKEKRLKQLPVKISHVFHHTEEGLKLMDCDQLRGQKLVHILQS
ncbi:GroES-like protein [Violaceomyces palustris]|uniref:GroES-like protein n=1 Tax=Violaceomyces palustris TaxID=1673888 RepID=A0ACD0P338_9BASI|nr:GroES-like protein [Violaceomyces palustris]